eukprot:scaffold67311_cov29-Attheya_sp.AAC.1
MRTASLETLSRDSLYDEHSPLIKRARLSGAASFTALNTHPGLSYPSCVLAAVSATPWPPRTPSRCIFRSRR